MPEVISPLAFAPREDQSPDMLGAAMSGADWIQALKNANQQRLLNKERAFSEHETGMMIQPLAQSLMGERGAGAQLALAQALRARQEANNPFALAGGLSGVAREALGVELLGKQYGANSPVYQDAKRAFQNSIASSEMLNNYRQSLIDTSGKRASTALGKTMQEQREAELGYIPGTGKSQRFSPEEAEEAVGGYKLGKQKLISDSDTRKRALYASNIDKTIEKINPKDLTQYAGIVGKMKESVEKSKAAFGKESKDYDKYQRSIVNAQLLAKQVRQFYGDSIQPDVQAKLTALSNPSTWSNNPKLAAQMFNEFKDTLEKETSTYRGGLKNVKEFEEKPYQRVEPTRISADDIMEVARHNHITPEQALIVIRRAGHQYEGVK